MVADYGDLTGRFDLLVNAYKCRHRADLRRVVSTKKYQKSLKSCAKSCVLKRESGHIFKEDYWQRVCGEIFPSLCSGAVSILSGHFNGLSEGRAGGCE